MRGNPSVWSDRCSTLPSRRRRKPSSTGPPIMIRLPSSPIAHYSVSKNGWPLMRRAKKGRFVAVMVLDLNNFKELNDTLGHVAGDRVLEETARRLTEALPSEVTVARLGGDEFAVILPDLPATNAYQEHAETIRESLAMAIEFNNMRIPIS